MPTQNQYLEAIGRAGLTVADEALALVNAEKGGCQTDWSNVFCEVKKIRCAQFFFRMGDYVSDDAVLFYNQLLGIAGTNHSDATIDPNAQIPNIIINVNTMGSNVNSTTIPFTNQTTISITGYQSTYYPSYGNNPVVSMWIANGDGSYNEDTGNVPTIVRDGSGNIQSITWGAYPVNVSGYVSLLGVQPTT